MHYLHKLQDPFQFTVGQVDFTSTPEMAVVLLAMSEAIVSSGE
jgi:hypothetical protein